MQSNILGIWVARNFNIRQWATAEVFTNLMREYNVNHITNSPHYQQSNGLAEKYVQIVKNLFYEAKEEGKDMFKCLMVYHNTPLSSSLQSPMQILSSRSARSDLPMSDAARNQLGLDYEDLRNKYKNEHLPSHDLHIDPEFMYQSNKIQQVVVSCHHYKTVERAQKLHNYNQRECPI